MKLVAVRTVEETAGAILVGPQVVRSDADVLFHHGRRVAERHVINIGATVCLQHTVLQEVVRHVADKLPFAVRIEVRVGIGGGEAVGARHRASDLRSLRQQRLGFGVGVERLSFLDADRLHVEALQRSENLGRLLLDELGEHLEERDGVRRDRVEPLRNSIFGGFAAWANG